ncbi:hypothetical protein EGR_10103 [Echinococcus granulosus]|uniref:Uncharacterized protein n=1 Tax=Echinococcus granulosus TaxID=6210 RepID=W6U3B1_ECHGR|nr:hypothetical protein EGR_10103 [Echinococcus granulosus]EUB55031.1 hypothetical protein EGR_10103 [Echinococcus granulosus]
MYLLWHFNALFLWANTIKRDNPLYLETNHLLSFNVLNCDGCKNYGLIGLVFFGVSDLLIYRLECYLKCIKLKCVVFDDVEKRERRQRRLYFHNMLEYFETTLSQSVLKCTGICLPS